MERKMPIYLVAKGEEEGHYLIAETIFARAGKEIQRHGEELERAK